jgi:hypothetical protein
MMELHHLISGDSGLFQKHETAVGFGYIEDVHAIMGNRSRISMTRVI